MQAAPAITLSFPQDDIACLTLDLPGKGANVLSRGVLEELEALLSDVERRVGLAGLIVRSAKPGIFIAGADLREFAANIDISHEDAYQLCRRGQTLFARLCQGPFVSIAAIDGLALGGGAELALWCDRRIMSTNPKSQLGLPEVKLGLFPGWGGTVRVPRIAGLSNAVEIICGGEPLTAHNARRVGLADDVAAPERLEAAAIAMIRAEQASGQFLNDRRQWSGPIDISETELGFLGATSSAYLQQETKGQYPAPLAALECMLEGALLDAAAAAEIEARGMGRLFGSPVNRALLNVFFLSDRNKKDSGVAAPGIEPKKIETVSVIGAGIMGAGIAAASLKRGLQVTLTDAIPQSLEKGVAGVLEEAAFDRESKGPNLKKTLELAPRLNGTLSDREIALADLVIEAVIENEKVKKDVYARLESQLREGGILATNTSTIPIARLAAGLKRPERFVGIHFFNPVRKMPLVEVIRGPKTSDETVVAAVAYAKRIGKSPIVVEDGPGFLVNRCLFPYMNESLELLCEGVSIDDVEKAAKKFGMPMGPITLFDVVGLDTSLYAGATMHEAFSDRCLASPLLTRLVKEKRLGQKSGAGFFKYDQNGKGKGQPDPEFDAILRNFRREGAKLSPEQITHRLFLPMLLEATRVLEDHKVRDPRDVDLGLIYGIGFPPFKGGLLFWADGVGAKSIVEWLKPFEPLGKRYQPTDLLKEMARSGKRFYALGE